MINGQLGDLGTEEVTRTLSHNMHLHIILWARPPPACACRRRPSASEGRSGGGGCGRQWRADCEQLHRHKVGARTRTTMASYFRWLKHNRRGSGDLGPSEPFSKPRSRSLDAKSLENSGIKALLGQVSSGPNNQAYVEAGTFLMRGLKLRDLPKGESFSIVCFYTWWPSSVYIKEDSCYIIFDQMVTFVKF